MICLKNLAIDYKLAVMTGIHQPNVTMMFDKLYVLAKGRHYVFDVETIQLKSHLEHCQVECLDWQVPIEELIKVASKDPTVS